VIYERICEQQYNVAQKGCRVTEISEIDEGNGLGYDDGSLHWR